MIIPKIAASLLLNAWCSPAKRKTPTSALPCWILPRNGWNERTSRARWTASWKSSTTRSCNPANAFLASPLAVRRGEVLSRQDDDDRGPAASRALLLARRDDELYCELQGLAPAPRWAWIMGTQRGTMSMRSDGQAK